MLSRAHGPGMALNKPSYCFYLCVLWRHTYLSEPQYTHMWKEVNQNYIEQLMWELRDGCESTLETVICYMDAGFYG